MNRIAILTHHRNWCAPPIESKNPVISFGRDIDRYRRAGAVVQFAGRDSNQEMVREMGLPGLTGSTWSGPPSATVFCSGVHFITSAEAAASWLSRHPETTIIRLKEAWQLGYAVMQQPLQHEMV
ncbi:organomercurial lyase [Geomonas agri]|uniref:organomercurial lyase n=1 Tax=Geomonas agri TaxID=2873702 RepID=UPI00384FB6BF